MDDFTEINQLHFAAQHGDLRKVQELIGLGCSPNQFDELAKTPLHYAAEAGHIVVVRYLIEAGANVNAHDEKAVGNTPLREIAGDCSFEMAKVLIDAGADPTIPGWMQITALHQASERKRGDGPKVFELLKEAARKFPAGRPASAPKER